MFNPDSKIIDFQNSVGQYYPIMEENKNNPTNFHQFLPFQNTNNSKEIITSTPKSPPHSPKKRKNKEIDFFEISKKVKVEEKNENVDINVLTLDEFETQIKADTTISSKQKFEKLLSLFTKTENNDIITHNLWLEIPKADLWMNFIIDEREYDSQCFHESEQDYPLKSAINQSYYFINACHDTSVNHYYLQIRIDKELKIAEIIHIERAPNFSGNEVKALSMAILDFLAPQKVFLNDDAKIPKQLGTEEISLRVSLPIVSDNQKTWYSKFKPMTYPAIKLLDGQMSIDQNEYIYNKAIKIVRNTIVKDLITPNERKSKLMLWMNRYVVPFELSLCSTYTVHLLGKAIYAAMKVEKTRVQATFDFSSFYKNYLVSKNVKVNFVSYKQALDILMNHKIFVYES